MAGTAAGGATRQPPFAHPTCEQFPLCLAFFGIKLGSKNEPHPFQNTPCPGEDDNPSIAIKAANSDVELSATWRRANSRDLALA